MTTLKKLSTEIEQIKSRNKKVEIEKAWEISNERKIVIAILTCFTTILFMFIIGDSKPIVNGIFATIGFILSTLSLDFLKQIWIAKKYKK